ncbi:MAG: hypothetical protein MOGMAGMI_02207 [Candidatus Omnitrophica bacterium]|nr:hypothetical protein [Candidatus Omnitrophota bacterium]
MLRRTILAAALLALLGVSAFIAYDQVSALTARMFVEKLLPYPSAPFAVAAGAGAACWTVGLVWLLWDIVMAVVRRSARKTEDTHV